MAIQKMSNETRDFIRQELESGRDEVNPTFIFQSTSTTLLLAIADGQLDSMELAHQNLANRGLDANGNWVGFEKAREIHGIHAPAEGNDPVVDSVAEAIAHRHLRFTLRSQNCDGLDFHEVSIWSVRDALVASFQEGVRSSCRPGSPEQEE